MIRTVFIFFVFFVTVSCGFTPMYSADANKVEASSISIDYIGEIEGQVLRFALEDRLARHQSQRPINRYRVGIKLDFKNNLESVLHVQDVPNWWEIECTANVVITLANSYLPTLELKEKIGVQGDFEGRKIVFQKVFFESASVVTGVSPASFELGKTQAREQIIEQLSVDIYQELLWFMLEDQKENGTEDKTPLDLS